MFDGAYTPGRIPQLLLALEIAVLMQLAMPVRLELHYVSNALALLIDRLWVVLYLQAHQVKVAVSLRMPADANALQAVNF
ncbi:hypothetical protein M422DRAFT_262372 [Sphaerobolus stellatus SS14]|uniref:Uncharacterized protein n=1 Tax=Sphaerobolus stellatus (strain SS14) TaxID=990650 RepID=A0A0C9VD16_SPHS4|nr:hypothetical protein M422DRAFT_262372 [Sphaerobolus stellatus SS14]